MEQYDGSRVTGVVDNWSQSLSEFDDRMGAIKVREDQAVLIGESTNSSTEMALASVKITDSGPEVQNSQNFTNRYRSVDGIKIGDGYFIPTTQKDNYTTEWLEVWNVDESGNFNKVKEISAPNSEGTDGLAYTPTFSEKWLIRADNNDFSIFDVSDPANVTLENELSSTTANNVHGDMSITEDGYLVTPTSYGLQTLDVDLPNTITLVEVKETYDGYGATFVKVSSRNTVIALYDSSYLPLAEWKVDGDGSLTSYRVSTFEFDGYSPAPVHITQGTVVVARTSDYRIGFANRRPGLYSDHPVVWDFPRTIDNFVDDEHTVGTIVDGWFVGGRDATAYAGRLV